MVIKNWLRQMPASHVRVLRWRLDRRLQIRTPKLLDHYFSCHQPQICLQKGLRNPIYIFDYANPIFWSFLIVFVLIAQLRVSRLSSNCKQKQRRPKTCIRKPQFSQSFVPKFKKVDSTPKSTYYDGSEFVHKPYIHLRCMRCILLKDLEFC